MSFIKKYWVFISSITGTFFLLILNAPTLITNLENLPADISRIATTYKSWYYDDEAWTGFWSEFAEGYVDLEEANLANVELGIDITSKGGEIVGMIGTEGICELPTLVGFLHIEGKVSGNEAVITAFDYIGGKRRDFTRLTLKRDEIVMTVEPLDGIVDIFPQKAQIGRHPHIYPAITESLHSNEDSDIASDYFGKFCEEKRKALAARLKKNSGNVRLPVDQL